jgi:hypothetical protein
LISTTSHSQIQPVDNIATSLHTPPSEPIPTSVPVHIEPSPIPITNDPDSEPKKSHSKPEKAKAPEKLFTATITSMHNLTARATYTKQIWDPKFQKHYLTQEHVLVHDPFAAKLLKPSSSPNSNSSPSTTTDSTASQPRTPSEVAHIHTLPSLLRVNDIISYRPFTPSELLHRSSRRTFFSALELTRKLRTAGKHRQQIVNDHLKSKAKNTRTNRGVRFVVERVISAFGEGMDDRVRKVRDVSPGILGGELGVLDGSVLEGGERLAWWKRREQRGRVLK